MRGLLESLAITPQGVRYLVDEIAASPNRLVHPVASSTPVVPNPPWDSIAVNVGAGSSAQAASRNTKATIASNRNWVLTAGVLTHIYAWVNINELPTT